mmetsp:Transcript_94818/g.272975  ORF Transcript_94818/g.272975 Transcript_94818/m.272975 type:complete len:261 (-) Transcript_94818:147-929(-)
MAPGSHWPLSGSRPWSRKVRTARPRPHRCQRSLRTPDSLAGSVRSHRRARQKRRQRRLARRRESLNAQGHPRGALRRRRLRPEHRPARKGRRVYPHPSLPRLRGIRACSSCAFRANSPSARIATLPGGLPGELLRRLRRRVAWFRLREEPMRRGRQTGVAGPRSAGRTFYQTPPTRPSAQPQRQRGRRSRAVAGSHNPPPSPSMAQIAQCPPRLGLARVAKEECHQERPAAKKGPHRCSMPTNHRRRRCPLQPLRPASPP